MIYTRILINQQQLHTAIERLAGEITSEYSDRPFVALTLLEGARYFANDLLEKINIPFEQRFIKISSYHGIHSGDTVNIDVNVEIQQYLRNKDILIIDDIYDTGKTLSRLLEWLEKCSPRSVKTCVLLEKQLPHIRKVPIDFQGMTVEDVFVIGYGMDYNGQYREMPFIAELSSEIFKE